MTIDTASALTLTLRTLGLPVVSVSVGDPANKATWRVDLDPAATAQQRSDAAAALATFDVTAGGVIAAMLDQQASGAMQAQILKALLATQLDQQLGRTLTAADAPALRALFTKTIAYYKFIVANGL